MSPPSLHPCDPHTRVFPAAWKAVWFRQHARTLDGDVYPSYECPRCRRRFNYESLDSLEGDHVWPYSLFGATTWTNYQLLCSRCNLEKSNRLSTSLRSLLSGDDFREVLRGFLRSRCAPEEIANDVMLRELLM